MQPLGRVIQVVGLLLTGYAALGAFDLQMSEGRMFAFGFGGFGVFWLGTLLVRGRP